MARRKISIDDRIEQQKLAVPKPRIDMKQNSSNSIN